MHIVEGGCYHLPRSPHPQLPREHIMLGIAVSIGVSLIVFVRELLLSSMQ